MTNVYIYEALHPYDPVDNGHDETYIPIDPGDMLEIPATFFELEKNVDFKEPKDVWLQGRNLTQGSVGLFPGHPFVSFLRTEVKMAGPSIGQSVANGLEDKCDDSGYGTPGRDKRLSLITESVGYSTIGRKQEIPAIVVYTVVWPKPS